MSSQNRYNSEWYSFPAVTAPLDDTGNTPDPTNSLGYGYGGFPVVKRSAAPGLGKYRSQGIMRYQLPRPETTIRKTFNGGWHNSTLWTQGSNVYNTFTYYQAYSSQWSQGTYPAWNASGDTPAGAWLSSGVGPVIIPMLSTWHTWVVELSIDFWSEPVDLTTLPLQYRFALVMFDSGDQTNTEGAPTIGGTAKKIKDEKYIQVTRNSNSECRRTVSMMGMLPNQINTTDRPEQLAAEIWVARAWTTTGGGTLSAPGWRIVDVRGEMYMHPYPAPLAS